MADIHFVIGIWRSGTTMLKEVLDMSDEIKVFPEHFVLLNHLAKANHFSEEIKLELLETIKKNKDFLHFAKPNISRLEEDIKTAKSFEQAAELIYASCLKTTENPSIFIDKNPIYSYYLPELMKLFPRAKFVWMLREPKDNCISRAKHNIQSIKNYKYLAYWWKHTNELIAEQALQNPNRFLLIHYDAMCESPETYIKKICDFLDTPYTREMLDFSSKKDEKITEYLASIKARDGQIDTAYLKTKYAMWENLQQPINTLKIRQWENDLTEKQIDSIDKICSQLYTNLIKSDYKPVHSEFSIWGELTKLSLANFKRKVDNKKKS